jgi:hypothetical protein
MICEEIKQSFSLYADDQLGLPARSAFDQHLRQCPVCRVQFADYRTMINSLARLPRPTVPSNLAASITSALRIEAGAQKRQPTFSVSEQLMRWLQPRLMPYTVGAFASIIFFAVMFAGLRSSLMAFRDWDSATRQAQDAAAFQMFAGYDINRPIRPESYAADRAPFSIASPSLNPSGALAAFTRSAVRGAEEEEDDMVVVTDVFSNGSASLAEVMQAPRDPRMLDRFQDALRKNPAFVPASFDRRPQTMRVVFVIQKVDVRERQF